MYAGKSSGYTTAIYKKVSSYRNVKLTSHCDSSYQRYDYHQQGSQLILSGRTQYGNKCITNNAHSIRYVIFSLILFMNKITRKCQFAGSVLLVTYNLLLPKSASVSTFYCKRKCNLTLHCSNNETGFFTSGLLSYVNTSFVS